MVNNQKPLSNFPAPKILTKRDWVGLVAIIFLLLVGIGVLINLRRPTDLQRRALGPTPDATVSLASSADLGNLTVGTPFTVEISVTTTTNQFYGMDVVLDYDPSILQVTSIGPVGGQPYDCTSASLIFAPIVSDVDCSFDTSRAITGSSPLEFGVVSFDWSSASTAGYKPDPLPAGVAQNLAAVTFTPLASGSATIKLVTSNNNGSPCAQNLNCGTTDTNVAAVSSTNEVGDILSSLNPQFLNITVGGGVACILFEQGNADCSPDGVIDISDVTLAFTDWQRGACAANDDNRNTDFTGEGDCDISDVTVAFTSWQTAGN